MAKYDRNEPNKCEVPGCENLTHSYLCEDHLKLATGLAEILACRKCGTIIKITESTLRTIVWQEECESCKDLKHLGVIKG